MKMKMAKTSDSLVFFFFLLNKLLLLIETIFFYNELVITINNNKIIPLIHSYWVLCFVFSFIHQLLFLFFFVNAQNNTKINNEKCQLLFLN